MIEVMLVLERPSSEQLDGYSRGEKYRLLRSNTEDLRAQLFLWIEEEGLSDEIARIEEPTVFNTLFVVCTPEAASHLRHAPGVISVRAVEDFEVDLPVPEEDSITDAISDAEEKDADWW